MKVHAFRVEPQGVVTLPEVLERISKRPFRDRRVTEGKFAMRLEASRKRKKQWSLEFVLIRELGPGLAAMNAPLTDFDMADTDGFGEETAGFYDEQTNFMTLQYNHFGPRVGRIQSYLSAFAQKINPEEGLGFFFTPVIHPDAGDRLRDMRVVKKLEVTGYLPGIAAVDQPAERGLKDLLSVPLIGGTHKISVQMSAERGKSLSVRAVTQAVAEALRRDDHVTVLRVSGSTEDDPHAEIDLLNARLEESFEIGRRGRRSSRDERWKAVKQAFLDWKEAGFFQ